MNYIIDLKDRIMVNSKVINKTLRSYINSLCINNLSTLKGRLDATKKLLNIKYNLPIYVNKDMILFKIKEDEKVFWINYNNIKDYGFSDDIVTIVFNNLEILKVKASKESLVKRIKMIKILEEHL